MKIRKTFLLLVLCFTLCFKAFSQSVVNIESAEKTEYKKDAETGDESVIFTGGVKLSVTKDENKTNIEADSVIFNRTRSTIFATGNVSFSTVSKSESSESLTANSLYYNIETQQGVFDDTRVVQESSNTINISSGTKLVVSSDLFGRANSETVTFKDGTLTFCEEENPHWKIKASRIWLLPGTEFGFLNARVYIGALPIFYLPFFYYPKNELIFNPVLGYRTREGHYTQTTTYFLGQKEAASQNTDDKSLMSFMKASEQKKQVREGLFLKNTDEEYEKSDKTVKLMADLYSNLGFFTGVSSDFNNLGIISNLKADLYLGFSNTIFENYYGQYSIYDDSNKKNYDWSNFLGIKLPFRFYTNFSIDIAKSPFSFSLEMPLYSDYLFENDFLQRNETMDWISFLLNGANNEDLSNSSVNSFSWNMRSSISKPSFVSVLSPYVENFSISSISSTLNFASKSNNSLDSNLSRYSPNRSFYYPSSIQPLKMNVNISGTILSLQSDKKSLHANNAQFNADFIKPDFLLNDGDVADNADATKNPDVADNVDATKNLDVADNADATKNFDVADNADATKIDLDQSFLPSIQTTTMNTTNLSGVNYSLTYDITPSFNSEITLLSEKFNNPDEIDISKIKSSFISVKVPIKLNSSVSAFNNFFSMTNSFNAEQAYQSHPVLNNEIYPSDSPEYEKILTSDYSENKFYLTNKNTFTFKPFVLISAIKDTSLSLNSSVKLINSRFSGTVDQPKWSYDFAKWDSEHITSHNMAFSFNTNQKDGAFSESLTLQANLPPLVNSYTTKLSLKFPFCSDFSASLTYKQKSDTDLSWTVLPLTQNSVWTFFNKKLTINQTFKYNIEENHSDLASISIKGFGLTASFNMSYTLPYVLDNDGFWTPKTNKEFLPYDFRLSYSMPSKKISLLNNKITIAPTLNSEVKLDLIQITNSYLSITPGFTFNITNKFSLSFSSVSRNNVMFRYFQDIVDVGVSMPGETNFFKDLLNSFAFWDNSLRQASGFKLKQLKITITHDLHDWTLNSSYTMEPRLIKTSKPYKYQFSSYFTLSIVWNPMNSLKTTIEDKYGEFALNP